MSSIYDIDFGLVAGRLSPPSKRQPLYLAWMTTLFAPLQWFRNRIFNDYADSSNAPEYQSSTTYHFGDMVIFEKAVYQNISNSPISGIVPSNTNNWYKIQDNYIGVRERLIYNSQTIVLREILNKAFETDDMLIDNTDNDIDIVYFYNEPEGYPAVYYCIPSEDTGSRDKVLFLYTQQEYSPAFDFIVKAPSVLNVDNTKQLIAAEVDKYKIAGVNFDVQFYTPTA